MRMITKLAASALAPALMAAAMTPAAAQTIVSPPPGTPVTITGRMTLHSPFGILPGPGSPGSGCPFILNGKILSATPGVIQVDSVVSCQTFTVPMFFRFTTASTGEIDRLEATGLVFGAPPSIKCGADDIFFTWTNPNSMYVPPTDGETSPGVVGCRFEIRFTVSPNITVV